jgi:hypothetical protein
MSRSLVILAVTMGIGLSAVWAEEAGKTDRRLPRGPAVRAPAAPPAPARPGEKPAASGPVERLPAVTPPVPPPPRPLAGPVPVVPAKEGQREHRRVVLPLRAVPATDLANTLLHLLGAEGKAVPEASKRSVVIVADPISNSLVIGGPPDAVEDVVPLVEQLDRPAAMVQLEVEIVEAPAAELKPVLGTLKAELQKPGGAPAYPRTFEKPARMEVLIRARLTTLDNQPAFLKVGRREARVIGTSVSSIGRASSVSFEDVGTSVGFTPRVGPDRVVTMAIDVEDSQLGRPEEGATLGASKEGEPIRAPNTETSNAQATLRILDGQTVVLGGLARQAKTGHERLLLVTARVLPVGGR